MKITAIKSLVYKEFYMARKQLLIGTATFLIFTVICLMVEVSFLTGNLANLSADIAGEIKAGVDFSALLYPILMACSLTMFVAETSLKDEAVAWKRFCYAAPASHIDFAVAKYAAVLITLLVGMVPSFAYAVFLCRIMGVGFSAVHAAYILAAAVLMTMMVVLNQVGVLLFHTKDKAGMFMFGVLIGIVLIFAGIYRNSAGTELTKEVVDRIVVSWLPWLPVMIIAIPAAGCAVSAALYRRREA